MAILQENNKNILDETNTPIVQEDFIDGDVFPLNVVVAFNNISQSVQFNSLKISNKINNNVDECSFKIRQVSGGYRPNLNDEIEITHNSVKIFGGNIVRVTETSNSLTNIVYDVKCIDYSGQLRRILVTERYENETVDDIVDDLIDKLNDISFTTNGVQITKLIRSISFNGLTVADCLNKLAEALNAFWYVDYNKDIHFFEKMSELAPFNLTDNSGNYIYESLEIEEDISQLRNRVTVRGGTTESDANRTETIVCQDDTQDIFPLGYKFARLPIVEVNGTPVTVGTEYLTDDASVDCQWSFQEKYIRFTAGNLPTTGDIITIAGKILIPIIVRTPNNLSIEEFGVFEYQIVDDTIQTNDQAIERAIAELQAYSAELHEGSFKTYNSGLRAGHVLNINSIARDKLVDVVIQSVELRPRTPMGDIEYTVSFATLKTFGIIEYLQNSLRNERVAVDEQETLLSFEQVDEMISIQDEFLQATVSSPPYNWSNDAGTTPNKIVWNFFTWV
jgi:hypothetical protein